MYDNLEAIILAAYFEKGNYLFLMWGIFYLLDNESCSPKCQISLLIHDVKYSLFSQLYRWKFT